MTDSSSFGPFRTSLLRFLASPAILNGAGSVYSWVNPEHPGFIYPEAMGLYLRLVSRIAARDNDSPLRRRADEVASGLDELTPEIGGVGMAGKLYLFDTCMAVSGLVAYRRSLRAGAGAATLEKMGRFIKDLTRRRVALVAEDGSPAALPHHWSTVFGTHMLKTVIALDSLAEETGDKEYRELANGVADEVLEGCLRDGVFRISSKDTVVYTHAHCYSLEGLLYLRAKGHRDTTPILVAGADRLREWQNPDGSMFNWQMDDTRQRSKVGDATAQTVRIWIAVDHARYAEQIRRGLVFLSTLQAPESGIYYCAGSRDVNSISSVFATQAVDWHVNGAAPEWLV